MGRCGNDETGFSIDLDTRHNLVRVVGWGFWDASLAKGFDYALISACRKAPNGAGVVLDMGRLKPMRDEGQTAFTTAFSMLKVLEIEKVSVVTTSHLVKLQLMRLAMQAGLQKRARFI